MAFTDLRPVENQSFAFLRTISATTKTNYTFNPDARENDDGKMMEKEPPGSPHPLLALPGVGTRALWEGRSGFVTPGQFTYKCMRALFYIYD